MNQSKQPAALIVDDEPDIRELLDITLTGMNISTHLAATLGEAKHLLATRQPDFCLTDMRLPDGSGLELVEEISRQDTQIPVAVITAFVISTHSYNRATSGKTSTTASMSSN